MKNQTSDIVTRFGEDYLKEMKKLQRKPYVKVGILQDSFEKPHQREDEKSQSTIGQAAVANEFGAPSKNIPERSWLRSTFDAKIGLWDWGALAEDLKKKINEGKMNVERALKIMGARQKADYQAKIRSNIPPENKSVTIARKGSSSTLIDTGQTLNSIDYDVRLTE